MNNTLKTIKRRKYSSEQKANMFFSILITLMLCLLMYFPARDELGFIIPIVSFICGYVFKEMVK